MTDTPFQEAPRPAAAFEVYNEGLTVFLYDASHEEELRAADPEILYGLGDEAFDDPVSQRLLSSGKVLIYGLVQDDPVRGRLCVTAPDFHPAPQESWILSENGFLDLPSGRLCIHSYNSLPMGDNEGEAADPGAQVEVPAGRYRVLLQRWADPYTDPEPSETDGDRLFLIPVQERPAPGANILFGDCVGYEPDRPART